MAYTGQEIIDSAQYRNIRNKDDLIDNTEALRIIDREQRKVYILAARENPEYFGTVLVTPARAAYTESWDLSGYRIVAITDITVNAIADTDPVSYTQNAVDDPVNLVHYLHPGLMPAPRAYIRGRQITSVGTELGTADDNMVSKLNIFYSPFPAALAAVGSATTLPDEWADLLIIPLARMWAIRDGGREEEAQSLMQEYVAVLTMFTEAVKLYDVGAVKPLTAVRPVLAIGGAEGATS